jgi:hypothetical protein
MERGKEYALGRGQLYQLGYLGGSDGHGLIHDHVFVGFEKLPGDLEVGSAGGGHDEQPERGVGQQVVERAISDDAGIALGGKVSVALDHRCQFKSFDGGQKGRMKDPRAHAETYQTHSNHKVPPKLGSQDFALKERGLSRAARQ